VYTPYEDPVKPCPSQLIQAELDELNAREARLNQELLDFIVRVKNDFDLRYGFCPDISEG
jgi:hypothetical protein